MQKEYVLRQERVRRRMLEDGVEACLISSNTNIIYLTGTLFAGFVYMDRDVTICFVRRPSGLDLENVVYIRKPEQLPELLAERSVRLPKSIWLEEDEMTHSEWLRISKIFPDAVTSNSTHKIREVRAVKSDFELELVRQGGRKQSEAIMAFPSLFRQGMTDNDFAIEMEREARKRGSLGIVRVFGQSMEIYMGAVLSGENAGAPSVYDFALGGAGLNPTVPVGQNGTPLCEGQTVLVDICGNYNGYHCDQTRVFSVGKTTEKALYAHQVSIEILNEVALMGQEGVACCELYNKAVEIAKRSGLDDCFMGGRQKAGFIGHGIGLVLNELPVLAPKSKMILQAGMTIAVEPKFVIDGVGAVGNENTYIVHKESAMESVSLAPEEIVELKV